MAVKDEIKSILDGWVRVETQAREAEQAELVKQVVSSVQKQLEDPKLQKEIMANSIAEIEGHYPIFFYLFPCPSSQSTQFYAEVMTLLLLQRWLKTRKFRERIGI